MDTGLEGGRWATLVVIADGTTSLYTSTGGGIIGAGAHAAVAQAGQAWLSALEGHLELLPRTDRPGLPAAGHVVIRALTFGGERAVEAPEADLGHGRDPASPLFHAAHAVITEMRLLEESREGP